MPKTVDTDELDRIAGLIARHPGGIGVDGLASAFGAISRRTLQRRLAWLSSHGRIVAEGEGRATRYRFPDMPYPANLSEPTPSQDYIGGIALSREGGEIKAQIRRPRLMRQPVGYRVEFLERYHPNESAYLPPKLRAQLHGLGRSAAAQAPAGTFARDILNRLLIDLSWASSRLEGNTYSRLDTERLIEFGQAAAGKDAQETQMILNHKAAIEYLVNDPEHTAVAPETCVALHALLSDGLMPDPLACGRLRQRAVDIGGSVYLPVVLPQKIAELFDIVLAMAAEIDDPFEQAFFLMVHLPYLQPFEDVNKRVSRLAANIPLIRRNLSPLSFIDVPRDDYVDAMLGVYELNRVELLRDVFVHAYERSCQQYVAVRQQLVPPDTFRLRYRKELAESVRAIVRGGMTVDATTAAASTPATVTTSDRTHFAALVVDEFKALHRGNAVRFGLGAMEFEAWRERQP